MIGRLWDRLSRPWSRGMIVIVTAAVTATAVVLVTRVQHHIDEPPPLVEESWVEEQLTEGEPPSADSPLGDVEVPIPEAVEPAETLTLFEPLSGWTLELAALPAGRYQIHAGCGFVEPLVEEDGGQVMIDLWREEQEDETSVSFTVECGGPAAPTDHELVFESDSAVAVSGSLSGLEVEVRRSDEHLVKIDGELVNGAYVAIVMFVPVTG